MLTDAALKSLKARQKPYKVADRDGMYVVVSPAGGIVFRLDYRLHGRRETLTIGRYGRDGISLAEAREEGSVLNAIAIANALIKPSARTYFMAHPKRHSSQQAPKCNVRLSRRLV